MGERHKLSQRGPGQRPGRKSSFGVFRAWKNTPDFTSPDFSLTFSIFPDFSLTTFEFPDFSRFSRWVVTLLIMHRTIGLTGHIGPLTQARRLSLFGHTARMPDKSDAKQILTASSLENWRRPPGRPPYYVDEDYPAGPGIIEPLPEWSNWRGWESSTLENDVYVWHYALIVVTDRNEWMN